MKLTPVIEIAYCNQGIEPPDLYPKIKHSHEWDLYRAATHQKAGFEMPMKPFREGFFLFDFDAVSEFNLEKLVRDHLDAAEECDEEPIPLAGGFVLEENGKILLTPQCCGDLSDIEFWRGVSGGRDDLNWEAHPLPDVTYKDGRAFFTCVDDLEDFEEPFVESFDVSLVDLARAAEVAEEELRGFKARLESLLERLNLPRYADLLTFNRNAQSGKR
ncbi:hypothetical protein N9B63_04445 [Akkermansiaceae bacterium]|nr:hypothetical protein [Akkermansiaceae bacterium]